MIHEEFFSFVFNAASLSLLLEQPNSIIWINLIDDALKEKSFPQGHMILNIGQTAEYIFYLREGAIKAYYLDRDNQQQTMYLWNRNSIVTDIDSYIKQQPSDLGIRVQTDAQLMTLHRTELNRIIKEYPEAYQFINAILYHFFVYHRQQGINNQIFSAEERMDKLLTTNRSLELHFSGREIASHLHISHTYLYGLKKKKNIL